MEKPAWTANILYLVVMSFLFIFEVIIVYLALDIGTTYAVETAPDAERTVTFVRIRYWALVAWPIIFLLGCSLARWTVLQKHYKKHYGEHYEKLGIVRLCYDIGTTGILSGAIASATLASIVSIMRGVATDAEIVGSLEIFWISMVPIIIILIANIIYTFEIVRRKPSL